MIDFRPIRGFVLLLGLLLWPTAVRGEVPAEGKVALLDAARQSVPLVDGWRFYPDPRPTAPPDPLDPGWIQVPDTFAESGSLPPGKWAGGWFEKILRVEAEDRPEPLALQLDHPGASEVFLDGRRLARFGVVAPDEAAFDPRGTPVDLGITAPGTYRLTLRYSCADAVRPWIGPWLISRRGAGFEARISPTPVAIVDLLETRSKIIVLNMGLGGVALGFAVLHGLVFVFHRRHWGNLWFALFALGMAVNGICGTLLTAWGHFGLWELGAIRVVNLVAMGTLFFALLLFLAQLRPEPTYRAIRFLGVAYLAWVGLTFVPPLAFLHEPIYMLWIVLFAFALGSSGIAAWRAKPVDGGSLGLSALGLIWLIGAELIKLNRGLGVTAEVLIYGFGTLLIFTGASLFLARRIAAEGRELEILARHLESRVEERTRELERSEQEAQQASRAKSAFLATMSHEIRTPMNAVVGLAELLGEAEVPARERQMAKTLRRSAVSLLRLIDEILDLSRIESGHLELEENPMQVEQVLADVVELFGSQARRAGVELRAEVLPDPAPWILGDRDRFYQVVINLVGNALKFTAEGSVVLSAVLIAGRDAEHRRLLLEVNDTGIGITEEAQASLFEPFYQVDSSSTRHFGGAGLGLAICKQLADLMGAELRVESRPGQGSRFSLELEVAVTESRSDTGEIRAAAPDLPPLRILLAEDNPVNQWVVRLLLEELGQEARVEDNGPAALEAASSENFDVVILDLHMPGMDGVEVARRIRQKHGEKHPHLIAFTASVMEEDRRRCKAAGMNDFLAKPADLERLREALLRSTAAGG